MIAQTARIRPRWVISCIAFTLLTASCFARFVEARQPEPNKQAVTAEQEPESQAAAEGESDPAADARRARLLRSPRSTVRSLVEGIDGREKEQAVMCLDLSEVGANIVDIKGPQYALHLRGVLGRIWDIQYEAIPDDPDRPSPYVLGRDINIQFAINGQFDLPMVALADVTRIKLTRGVDGLWRFSPETVAAIDDLWDRWYDRPLLAKKAAGEEQKLFADRLRALFPKSLHGTTFLLHDYQWICLLVLIFLGFVADVVARFILHRLATTWFRLFRGKSQYDAQHGVFRPMGLLVQALVWYCGTLWIGLPDFALSMLLLGLKFFAVVSAVWSAYRLIDLIAVELAAKASRTNTKFDDLLIPLVSRSLKALAIVVGALACAEAFNLPITGLLGGLGLGGAALALASKDTISNLFGSFTVLVDRPFEIGDWIVTGDVEGTVETVGFRSTRIRTFYNSLVTLPNSLLTTAVVDNMGRRRFRRIKLMIGLQYDTRPEQVEAFCEGVRELIRRHPYSRKDYYHVYLNQFSASSIDILLYSFLECPDWSVELRERHRLMVDIMRLAEQLGCSFAFPTRTLHVHNEPESSGTPTLDLDDPLATGQGVAARIAGPFVSGEQRPGGVRFTGPATIDDIDAPKSM